MKTFRVQEIRPGPVKRNFVGKEKVASRKLLQKWSFRKFAQMDRDGVVVVVVILKDEMVAMAHYYFSCCCSRLL